MDEIIRSEPQPEDGYELWLRYPLVDDAERLAEYCAAIQQISIEATSPTLIAARDELLRGLKGLLGVSIPVVESADQPGTLKVAKSDPNRAFAQVGGEGFVISCDDQGITIAANSDIGVLYGVFAFLCHLQTHKPRADLPIISTPTLKYRLLNHWDNLDRTIERGYAGFSLWDWHKLPDYVDPRYIDYARANASLGINGAALTNVNANALILARQYLIKVAALADVFRPYGIRVYLTARFNAPIEIGGLATADPLDADVIGWWRAKAEEIYALIPDFGGFVVKANSEGQPGPHNYGRSHADGANLLADALAPHGGIICWRAFVYDQHNADDRTKQAYNELVPLDGTFSKNVLLQVKNGPLDFQPREPYHPLFGAMPDTPLLLEVQITQEYLGQATHLCYLAPLFKETLDAETYCCGAESLVSDTISGMAGVANIGDERNWCGHPFAAANWLAFGRLAWDQRATSEAIADDWLRLTFTNDARFIEPTKAMMMASREAVVDYMTPLGLHHIMSPHHHYGPAPWIDYGRRDWTSYYYHCADALGLGCDRSPTGTNAVSQYYSPYREQLANLDTCPEALLLWFHHVAWDYRLKSGRTLWDELCFRYHRGVEAVRQMQQTWDSLAEWVDEACFAHVRVLLRIQAQEARWWRDACLLYFQTFSRLPIPAQYEQPAHSLEYYKKLTHHYVPGIAERVFD